MQKVYGVVQRKLDLLGQSWTIHHYTEWEDYLFKSDDQGLEQIVAALTMTKELQIKMEFRLDVEVKTVKYLLGIYPQTQELYIGSHQLSNELTLIRHLQDRYKDNGPVEELKRHVGKIATIPVTNTPPVIDQVTFKHKLTRFEGDAYHKVDQRAEEIMQELVGKVGEYQSSLFERFSDFGLDLTARFMLVRIHLLKFLAVLPSLDHDKSGTEVKKILLETLRRFIDDCELARRKNLTGQMSSLPGHYVAAMKLGKIIASVAPAGLLASTIRCAVGLMAKRFIAGESIEKAADALKGLAQTNRNATIDQLGELVVSNGEADEYQNKVIEIIQGLDKHITAGELNSADIPKAHVSIKVSALASDFRPYAYDYTKAQVAPRLVKILLEAKMAKVFVNIDAEHYSFRDIVFKIYADVLRSTPELSDFAQTGIVVQAYLRDGAQHLLEVVELARSRGLRMPIRLVKGAYWDAETIEADAHNYNAPEFLNIEETHIHFRQMIELALQNGQHIQLAVASHNIADHSFAEALREVKYPAAPVIEHQCLHMTYEALSMGLAKMNWPVRNYIPVGELLVGMAYLVRRIMENSSQVGILTIMRSHKTKLRYISPFSVLRQKQMEGGLSYDKNLKELGRQFRNVYPIRPYLSAHLERFMKIFKNYQDHLGKGPLHGTHSKVIYASSFPEQALGSVEYDTADTVDSKINKLYLGYQERSWQDQRFFALLRFAELLLEQREELTSLIVYEAGKTLEEAIADVDEAIDFVNFYVREQIEREHNESLSPIGVVGVIAPWNFPLAIPCGMTVAALVAGNPVLLKPAEQTPLIAQAMVKLAYQAGVPENILQLAIGEAEVGIAMTDHSLICGIVFTGSVPVGKSIYQKMRSSFTDPRYPYPQRPKFAITEMGGKNAIVVTNNCEMDETVDGIIYSAFAHSGQKCSACSRVIIHNEIKESFIQRFVKAAADLNVGASSDFGTTINPLISLEDQLRVRRTAAKAAQEAKALGGRVLLDRSQETFAGYCVGPSIFELPKAAVLKGDTVASSEVFGPIIHVVGYDTLEEAVKLFNSTSYALTGGIFGQSQDDIDYLSGRLLAGNIYVNRPNTGARVAIEPFGGFKMSGTGPKAGGVDYLRMFSLRTLKVTPHVALALQSSGQYQMPLPVGLSFNERRAKVMSWLDRVAQDFEVLRGGVDELKKDELTALTNFLGTEAGNLPVREFLNRYIPGQLSFNKKDIGAGETMLVVGDTPMNTASLAYLGLSMLVGNPVLVAAHGSEALSGWQKVVSAAHDLGWPILSLHVCQLTTSLLEDLSSRPFRLILAEQSLMSADFVAQLHLTSHSDFLRKIVTVDEYHKVNFEDALSDVALTRSYAINTMRHGAPLELSL